MTPATAQPMMQDYLMSHRTQITLTDEQYERLRTESVRTGMGLAELVRRALDHTYGTQRHRDRIRALEDSFGAWTDREDDGAGFVEGLRRGNGAAADQPMTVVVDTAVLIDHLRGSDSARSGVADGGGFR